MTTELLVDQHWLIGRSGDQRVVLLDTRSADDYWHGHLVGARHFDATLFSHYDTSDTGLALLAAQYAAIFSLLGLSGDEHVVVYEDRSDSRAARAAWLLEYLGHREVSILDGGLTASPALTLENTAQAYAPRRFVPAVRPDIVVTPQEIPDRLNDPSFRVLDTRRIAEYSGREKRARRAGAIPGAKHRDYVDNIGADGKFKSSAELRSAYVALGLNDDDEIAAYCGGGVRAAHTYYALKLAGFKNPRNYTGSWGEWGNSSDLPIELNSQHV